jgi:endonuclease/exonuclease/phosphatase family metal-dependent hydrolase
MRIATYNVEWFNALFDDAGRLLDDDGWSGRQDVTRAEQTAGLIAVFRAMDADAVLVVEAPDENRRRSTVRALETFAEAAGIRAHRAILGFRNDTEQEIALLYDPDRLTPRHDPQGDGQTDRRAPRFDGTFRIDLDIDATLDVVTFSKPPLELACTTSGGRAFRMIGVHVKSKAPHGARNPDQAKRLAIANRRKQLAQCIWIRHRVEEHLARGDSLIVLGDFNDGPGLDEFEHLFGRSGVEIVMGLDGGAQPELHEPHARLAMAGKLAAQPSSARFYLPDQKAYLSALLDYVMVSSDLMAARPSWRIWHPFDDPAIYRDEALREALLAASDHFPVSVDLDL